MVKISATYETAPLQSWNIAKELRVKHYQEVNDAKDLCTYLRNYWGAMFLNRFPFGGAFPKPTFALQMHGHSCKASNSLSSGQENGQGSAKEPWHINILKI